MDPSDRLSPVGLIHLAVIYVVWGSTYLAIRIAVQEGAGWGPFWLGASRVAVAAVVLLGFATVIGWRVRPTAGELTVIGVSGLLMWVGGNGGVNWAEQRVESGLVALVIGTMPLWVATLESVVDRRPPTPRLIASLVCGFAGLAVLTAPRLSAGMSGDVVGLTVVVGGTISWGVGSILLSRRPVTSVRPAVVSGWQQGVGAAGFLMMVAATGEPLPQPTPSAWGAWAYLVVFGSLLAFTSYVQALRLLPTPVVMTYTYVNPAIAVVLGWAVLGERVTPSIVAGMALILVGVWGVFRDRRARRPRR
jgi:drug/metabolite transporter (DMT)-like permease